MSVISKLFESDFKYTPCEVILHPGMSCTKCFLHNSLHYIPSNIKFFLPVTLIPFLMRIRRADRKLLKDYALYFAETALAGYLVGHSITSLMCLFRRILGKHTVFTFGILPGFLAGFWLFALSDRAARLFSMSVAQAVLETFLSNSNNPVMRVFQKSRLIQTFIFMACSALVLQMIRQYKYKTFWFVAPSPAGQKNRENTQTNLTSGTVKCTHKAPCQSYILNGIKEYFFIGFALENIKILVNKIKHIKSVSDYFRQINLNAIAFLVSYVGVYRLSYCLINRYSEIDDAEVAHLLAGYLGGVSFIFYPKPAILAYALILLCEMTWRTLKRKQEKYPKWVQSILRLPMGRAVMPITLATMVRTFMFQKHLLSSLGVQMVNGATNSKGNEIFDILFTQLLPKSRII